MKKHWVCTNEIDKDFCQEPYACDACPYNAELKKDKEITGKSYTSVSEMLKDLNSKKNWTILDYIEVYWHRYIWNYLSGIPLAIKSFIQRGIRGYSDRDTWDFDRYLSDVIQGGVEHLIKYNISNDKKFITDLQEIVSTMKLARQINETYHKDLYTEKKKQFKKGMTVLTKRWFELWD